MQIREVMTESVVTAPPDCPVSTIAELMRERNVGSVVLVDGGGAPVGFITDRDLAVSVVADGRDASDPAEAHASSPVVTGEPEMDVHAAAELMVSHGVRRLPIGVDWPVRAAAVDDAPALRKALSGADVVISCAGPFTFYGAPVIEAALSVGAHYVDTTGEQPYIRRVFEHLSAPATT